ncbi:MAG: AMIN domain-containing protein [Candidatus Acidiferrales bacterium]
MDWGCFMMMTHIRRYYRAALAGSLLLFAAGVSFAQSQPNAPANPPALITQVQVHANGGKVAVELSGSGFANVHPFELHGPERVVLDFPSASYSGSRNLIAGQIPPVRRVRLGQSAEGVERVVIDLDSPAAYHVNPSWNSVTILFDAPAPSGASAVGPPAAPAIRSAAAKIHKAPAALPSSAAPAEVNPSPPPPDGFSNGMLTFHAKNQSLRTILEEIGRMADVAFHFENSVGNEIVSADFRGFDLDAALHQLLKDYDAEFAYGARPGTQDPARLLSVRVYAAGNGPGVDAASQDAWNARSRVLDGQIADANPEVRARAFEEAIRRQGRDSTDVVIQALHDSSEQVRSRALSRALFSAVPLPQDVLVDRALNDESSNVRFLALQALPADPSLRWVAERALSDSNPQVARMAQELLRAIDGNYSPQNPRSRKPPPQDPDLL